MIRILAGLVKVDMPFRPIKSRRVVSERVRPREYGAVRLAALAAALFTLLAPQINLGAAQELPQERLRREIDSLQCVGCHIPTAEARRFAWDPKTGKRHDVTLEFLRFHKGDHGELGCRECHRKGFGRFPHFPPREMRRCMDCHPRKEADALKDEKYEFERIKKEFEKTLHFTKFKKDDTKGVAEDGTTGVAEGITTGVATDVAKGVARGRKKLRKDVKEFTCEKCHDPHYFKATAHLGTPQQILEDNNEPCLRCHRAGATGPLADAAKPNLVALHDYLPRSRLHLSKARCIDCHTNTDYTVAHDLPSGEEANNCVSCHNEKSIMMSRHYRYRADPEEMKLGFSRAALLEDSYVMGATRHVLLDYVSYLLVAIAAVFIAVHGAARIIARVRRRGRSSAGSRSRDDRSP